MNKFLILLFFLTCSNISSAQNNMSQRQTDPNVVSQKPTLNVRDRSTWPSIKVLTHSFPPYQYRKNNKMVGPMLDILELVCEEAKIICLVDMGTFKDQYERIMQNDGDMMYTFLLDANKERNDQFFMSPPIVEITYSFFVTSSSNWKWTGKISDLDGRTIGVYGPSGSSIITQELAEQNSTTKVIIEPTNLAAFQQLVFGKYGEKATMVAGKEVGLAFLKNSNIYGPKLAGDIKKTDLGFGFKKTSNNVHLFTRMVDALNTIKRQGLINNILSLNNEYGLVPSK